MKSYAGSFISGGAAYNLVLPIRPDKMVLYNQNGFSTDGGTGMSTWFRDQTKGYAMNHVHMENDGGDDYDSLSLSTSNGFTCNFSNSLSQPERLPIDGSAIGTFAQGFVTFVGPDLTYSNASGSFTTRQAAISSISSANPAVLLCSAAHGFGSANDEIRVRITGAPEITLNNKQLLAVIKDNDELYLYELLNPNETVTGVTSWTVTLGTSVIGSDSDVFFFEAFEYDDYVGLGDIG